jgi:hypothetical protein
MASPNLPDSAEAYESLCARGEQFPKHARRVSPRGDTTYQHPTRGTQPVAIDRLALSATGRVHADAALHEAFEKYGTTPVAPSEAVATLTRVSDWNLVWGFSGFATAGYSYATEAHGMNALLEYLESTNRKPALITDGGVSDGVLGLSGVLAKRHCIPSMGFLPRQGLASSGPRDHLVVKMDTYRDRERLVGGAPDVLVCVGGGEGTRRECEAALAIGSTVLVLALKAYGPASLDATYHDVPIMHSAAREGRLLLCESVQDIPRAASRAIAAAARFSTPNRVPRMAAFTRLLAA